MQKFIIDSHFHLNHLNDIKLAVTNSIDASVKLGLIAGVWNEDTLQNISLFANPDYSPILDLLNRESFLNQAFQINENKFSCFLAHGLHPMQIHERWLSKNGDEDIEQIAKDYQTFEKILTTHLSFIWAIGEAGFDLSKSVLLHPNCQGLAKNQILELQNIAYEYLVNCAVKYNLPLILHLRAPWNFCYERITWAKAKGVQKIMIHCFSGSAEELQKLAQLSVFFSFGGVPTWRNAHKSREAFIQCPAHLRLLETDSPDLPPELPELGKLTYNEPARLKDIAQILSKQVNLSTTALIAQTNFNALKFLGVY